MASGQKQAAPTVFALVGRRHTETRVATLPYALVGFHRIDHHSQKSSQRRSRSTRNGTTLILFSFKGPPLYMFSCSILVRTVQAPHTLEIRPGLARPASNGCRQLYLYRLLASRGTFSSSLATIFNGWLPGMECGSRIRSRPGSICYIFQYILV